MSKNAQMKRNEMNAVDKEMKEMNAQAEPETIAEIKEESASYEPMAQAEAEPTAEPEPEKAEVTAEAEAEPETTEPEKLTQEEWDAKLLAMLRLYPRQLSVGQLIGYRTHGIEEWIETQRTPSHTKATAESIIDSVLQGISIGVITLGHNTDTDGISTINGSSRIDDLIRFYSGEIGKKDNGFKEIPKEMQKRFLHSKVDIHWLQGTTAELTRDFLNLNNNTALTGGQKALGKLVNSSALDVIKELKKHSVFSGIFSARQIQKEEPNNCIFLILANIKGVYASSISKVTEALSTKDCSDIDIAKLKYIFDKIESAEVELNKFKFVHLVHLMYIGDCWKSKSLHKSFDVDDIDNTAISVCASVNYVTAGTNSAEMNEKRIADMSKKLYLHLTTTGKGNSTTSNDEPTLNPADL